MQMQQVFPYGFQQQEIGQFQSASATPVFTEHSPIPIYIVNFPHPPPNLLPQQVPHFPLLLTSQELIGPNYQIPELSQISFLPILQAPIENLPSATRKQVQQIASEEIHYQDDGTFIVFNETQSIYEMIIKLYINGKMGDGKNIEVSSILAYFNQFLNAEK